MTKKILIIGSGGREHAIGWKLKNENPDLELLFSPGNAGTLEIGKNFGVQVENIEGLLGLAKLENVDLTFVGPEIPLAAGIVDLFEKEGLQTFGPTKLAAQIETDKSWATEFMRKYGIPQPEFFSFENVDEAKSFIKNYSKEIVIKASGLAAGKGVVLPSTQDEAIKVVEKIMVGKEFGSAGDKIVIQERISGPEISVFAICDGEDFILFPSAQDHKRIFDNDQGPNTGGMGTYAPVNFVDEKLIEEIKEKIIKPVLQGMKQEGHSYKGVLFAGIMVTSEGAKILEFNARFGDPETQSLMMLLESNLLPILEASIQGNIQNLEVKFKHGSAACIVLTSEGYPGNYKKGDVINGLEKVSEEVKVFHAGTVKQGGEVLTNGGRVLNIVSHGAKLDQALENVYAAIGEDGVNFRGMHFRKDIGKNV